MSDILELDATGQLLALQSGAITARELLERSIGRADELKVQLNAVVSRDLKSARRRADEIDRARAEGRSLGLLAGLPMTIKDTLDVDGLPASAGSGKLLNRPAGDAAVVARVKLEGAVIWGKTNVPVMAADWQSYNALYGTTNNPWNLDWTPGGSSGGAAAAVAAGITALEIGSDIGGSLRIPASFCGVFSHKPTYGLVNQRGHVPPAPGILAEPDLNVVGPIARSARDVRLLLSILADGPMPTDAPAAELKDLRVAVWLEDDVLSLDPEVRSVIEGFSDALLAEGAVVETVESPVPGGTLMDAYGVLLLGLLGADLPSGRARMLNLLRVPARLARRLGAGPKSSAAQILAYTASHKDWLAANETRARLNRRMSEFFERWDVLIAPSAPVGPFPHDHRPFERRRLSCSGSGEIPYASMLDWIALATTCGLPATAVPAGMTESGKPVGVQLIGPRLGDSRTLAIAQAVEERLGGYRRPSLGGLP